MRLFYTTCFRLRCCFVLRGVPDRRRSRVCSFMRNAPCPCTADVWQAACFFPIFLSCVVCLCPCDTSPTCDHSAENLVMFHCQLVSIPNLLEWALSASVLSSPLSGKAVLSGVQSTSHVFWRPLPEDRRRGIPPHLHLVVELAASGILSALISVALAFGLPFIEVDWTHIG